MKATSEPGHTDTVPHPACTQHWGDCTYYSSLMNDRPTDGVCTCGYGWTMFADSGGVDESQLYSEERRLLMDRQRGPDPVQPPAAAQEPPWVVAARDCGLSVNTLSVRIIEAACREHAAALAQDNERCNARLRTDLAAMLADRNRWQDKWDADTLRLKSESDAALAKVAEFEDSVMPRSMFLDVLEERDALKQERDQLTAERDEVYAANQNIVAELNRIRNDLDVLEERDALRMERDRLTAERDRLRQALKEIAEAYANNEPISAQWAAEALSPAQKDGEA
jgi:hypothetical protein